MKKDKLIQKYFAERSKILINEPVDLGEVVYLDMKEKSKILKTSLPLAIGLKITDKCNFKCAHCFVRNKKSNDMNLEVLLKILEGFGENIPYRIYLTGGEPFLNSDIFNIIQVIKNKNILLSIHTNGSMLTDDTIKKLSNLLTRKDYLQISIDSADPIKFREIRSGGNLSLILSNCNKLKQRKIRYIVNTVVTNNNVTELLNIYKLANKYGADQINYSPLMEVENNSTIKIFLPSDDIILNNFLNVLEYHFANKNSIKIKQDPLPVPWGNSELNPYISKSSLICPAGKTEAEIDMYGNMYLCPFLYESKYCMGNVLDMQLKDVWENKKFQIFSEKKWSKNKTCQLCNSYETCNSGCIAYAIMKNTDCDGRCFKQLKTGC